MRPGTRRCLIGAAITFGALATTAAPAAAHGPGGLQPTNYETRITRISPRAPGVHVRTVDLGTTLELTNTGDRSVTVLGYDSEPYLRVGPGGVYENIRSPAHFLNRSAKRPGSVPASADPKAPPEWRRIGDGTVVRWHDHRAHWMGNEDAPSVQRDPNRVHLIQRFRIDLQRDGSNIQVDGDVRWIPGSSPWPWLAAAALAGAAVLIACRRRRWGVPLGTALTGLVVAQTLHVVGLWGASTASSWSRLTASAYALGGIVLAVAALGVLIRRGPQVAVPLALLAALGLALAGGLADVTTLTRSQVPTTTSLWLDRLTVAMTLGIGAGVVGATAWRLRRMSPRPGAPATPAPTLAPGALPPGLQERYQSGSPEARSEGDSQS